MRKALNSEDLSQIAGGNAYINYNTGKMAFDSFDDAYVLKCTPEEAQTLCNSFIGQFATTEEYDTACRAALQERGWI